jgi:hypothetical protein
LKEEKTYLPKVNGNVICNLTSTPLENTIVSEVIEKILSIVKLKRKKNLICRS